MGSESRGTARPTLELEKEEEQGEINDDVAEGEKGIFKLKKDLETEDQGSEPHKEETPIEIIGEIKDEKNSEEKEIEKEQETEKDKTEEKSTDSFVKEVSEAEGRQEPFVEPEKEKEQAETKEGTEVTEGKKGIIKLKKDLETEDESVCSHE